MDTHDVAKLQSIVRLIKDNTNEGNLYQLTLLGKNQVDYIITTLSGLESSLIRLWNFKRMTDIRDAEIIQKIMQKPEQIPINTVVTKPYEITEICIPFTIGEKLKWSTSIQ